MYFSLLFPLCLIISLLHLAVDPDAQADSIEVLFDFHTKMAVFIVEGLRGLVFGDPACIDVRMFRERALFSTVNQRISHAVRIEWKDRD